mmetsp:Transcript_9213/g.13818  ORF Transcript_9213/g.13818 Transcript_9213/m.13818 type:complete len:206 (+) Transcript_9213:548-1165(+)
MSPNRRSFRKSSNSFKLLELASHRYALYEGDSVSDKGFSSKPVMCVISILLSSGFSSLLDGSFVSGSGFVSEGSSMIEWTSPYLKHFVQHSHVTSGPKQSAQSSTNPGKEQTSAGTVPFNSLEFRVSCFKVEIFPNSLGNGPLSTLLSSRNISSKLSFPISGGITPYSELPAKLIDFNVRMFINSSGISPTRLFSLRLRLEDMPL